MGNPFVMFADAQLGVIEILRAGLTAREEEGTVTAKVPKGKIPGSDLPLVLVRHDATPTTRYPVDQNCTVRVAVWHKTESDALRLAKVCHALVETTPGTTLIRATNGLIGPTPTSDPDTGEPMAFFTVSVHPRPEAA